MQRQPAHAIACRATRAYACMRGQCALRCDTHCSWHTLFAVVLIHSARTVGHGVAGTRAHATTRTHTSHLHTTPQHKPRTIQPYSARSNAAVPHRETRTDDRGCAHVTRLCVPVPRVSAHMLPRPLGTLRPPSRPWGRDQRTVKNHTTTRACQQRWRHQQDHHARAHTRMHRSAMCAHGAAATRHQRVPPYHHHHVCARS